jgi:hypothetical protein
MYILVLRSLPDPTAHWHLSSLYLPSTNPTGRPLCYYIVQTHIVHYIFQLAILNANCGGYTKKVTLEAVLFHRILCRTDSRPISI